MKTHISLLQEMMIKLGDTPHFELIAQDGPAHSAVFSFRCRARGLDVTGSGRSKRDAKQEAARCMLEALELQAGGELRALPPSSASAAAPVQPAEGVGSATRKHVALLGELCVEYGLGAPEYTLVADTGPSHLRHFTMRATVGPHARAATATTKKAARQLAAEQLFVYLRENLSRLTEDFDEEEALARAHERVMERHSEAKSGAGAGADAGAASWGAAAGSAAGSAGEGAGRRPRLAQRVADYGRALPDLADEEQLVAARAALQNVERDLVGDVDDVSPVERAVRAAAAALGLRTQRDTLPAEDGVRHILSIVPTQPALAFLARTPADAAEDAHLYLSLVLRPKATPSA